MKGRVADIFSLSPGWHGKWKRKDNRATLRNVSTFHGLTVSCYRRLIRLLILLSQPTIATVKPWNLYFSLEHLIFYFTSKWNRISAPRKRRGYRGVGRHFFRRATFSTVTNREWAKRRAVRRFHRESLGVVSRWNLHFTARLSFAAILLFLSCTFISYRMGFKTIRNKHEKQKAAKERLTNH